MDYNKRLTIQLDIRAVIKQLGLRNPDLLEYSTALEGSYRVKNIDNVDISPEKDTDV